MSRLVRPIDGERGDPSLAGGERPGPGATSRRGGRRAPRGPRRPRLRTAGAARRGQLTGLGQQLARLRTATQRAPRLRLVDERLGVLEPVVRTRRARRAPPRSAARGRRVGLEARGHPEGGAEVAGEPHCSARAMCSASRVRASSSWPRRDSAIAAAAARRGRPGRPAARRAARAAGRGAASAATGSPAASCIRARTSSSQSIGVTR